MRVAVWFFCSSCRGGNNWTDLFSESTIEKLLLIMERRKQFDCSVQWNSSALFMHCWKHAGQDPRSPSNGSICHSGHLQLNRCSFHSRSSCSHLVFKIGVSVQLIPPMTPLLGPPDSNTHWILVIPWSHLFCMKSRKFFIAVLIEQVSSYVASFDE